MGGKEVSLIFWGDGEGCVIEEEYLHGIYMYTGGVYKTAHTWLDFTLELHTHTFTWIWFGEWRMGEHYTLQLLYIFLQNRKQTRVEGEKYRWMFNLMNLTNI